MLPCVANRLVRRSGATASSATCEAESSSAIRLGEILRRVNMCAAASDGAAAPAKASGESSSSSSAASRAPAAFMLARAITQAGLRRVFCEGDLVVITTKAKRLLWAAAAPLCIVLPRLSRSSTGVGS
jgi:hypothetical protein